MIRILTLVVFLAAPLAAAHAAAPTASSQSQPPQQRQPSPPPPPPPRPIAPTTKPSPAELHAQAYGFMRQEKFDKATPLLNRAYNETPAAQRSRPLILNRALLDLVQRSNPLRGIKELYHYFARNPAPDEEASNLLGSLLELAAQNPRWRDGALYADGFREFARREAVLERHRTGFKRWGHRWISQQEFNAIREKDKELEEQILAQEQAVRRLSASQQSLAEQYRRAAAQVTGMGNHAHVRRHNDPIVINPQPCALCTAMYEASQSVNDISAELQTIDAQMKRETQTLDQLKSRLVKPQWPKRYDPIDPNAPPPPLPQDPALAAATPATQGSEATEPLAPDAATLPSISTPSTTRPTRSVR